MESKTMLVLVAALVAFGGYCYLEKNYLCRTWEARAAEAPQAAELRSLARLATQ
jgi:hypothetical protein